MFHPGILAHVYLHYGPDIVFVEWQRFMALNSLWTGKSDMGEESRLLDESS